MVADLFFEQDHELLGLNYRHGVLRSLAVLTRSLLLRRGPAAPEIASGSSVAVVFFPNELEAIRRAPSSALRVDRILSLDAHALAQVRHTLGLQGLARETARFVAMAWGERGWRCAGRLTYPLLGWLLHRSFEKLLAGKRDVTIITTNMQHPLSIGVARAATATGQASEFYEHATTPRLVFADRGYRHFHVQFEHTGRMLTDQGVSPGRVRVLNPMAAAPRPDGGPIRTAGICVNNLDALESVADITAVLKERGIVLAYRIHDADPRLPQLRRLADQHGARLSNARETRIEAFLQTVDLIVAGNSNVVADAMVAGRRVVYYWAGTAEMFDYYGLVTHHGLPKARDRDSLRTALDALQPVPATA
jgi:hypothetical protein